MKAFIVGGSGVALLLGSWIYSQHHYQTGRGTKNKNTHEMVSKYGGSGRELFEGPASANPPSQPITSEQRGKVHYTIPQFMAQEDHSDERRRMQPAPGREAFGRAYTKKGAIWPPHVEDAKSDSAGDVV